jgi:hypothetical protein
MNDDRHDNDNPIPLNAVLMSIGVVLTIFVLLWIFL